MTTNLQNRKIKALEIAKNKNKTGINEVAYEKQKQKELDERSIVPEHEQKFEREKQVKEFNNLKEEIADYLTDHHGMVLKASMFDLTERKKLLPIIDAYIKDHQRIIPGMDDDQLSSEMLDEIAGLGPIDRLIQRGDGKISEIWVNGLNPVTGVIDIFYEERGRIKKEEAITFTDQKHAYNIAEKIARNGNQQFGESIPAANVRYPDGRVNLVRSPIATGGGGPYISFRLFPKDTFLPDDLLNGGSMNKEMYHFLKLCFENGVNGNIAGPTGSGKTTLFTAMVNFISPDKRILLMEDTEEMRIRHKYPEKHIITEEAKFNKTDATKNYDLSFLTINMLRQKPDYALYGEVRGGEAFSMLNGASTGHTVWSTVHTRSASKAVRRLINMVQEHGSKMTPEEIGKWIAESLDIIVFQKQYPDKKRRIKEIIELIDFKDGKPVFNTLFSFVVEGKDSQGNIEGNFYRTGRISRELAEHFVDEGVDIDQLIPFMEEPEEHTTSKVLSTLNNFYKE